MKFKISISIIFNKIVFISVESCRDTKTVAFSCFAVVQDARATTVMRTRSCLPIKAGTAGN